MKQQKAEKLGLMESELKNLQLQEQQGFDRFFVERIAHYCQDLMDL